MKKQILLGMLTVLLTAISACGALYTESFNPSAAIPDGNPIGVTFNGIVSDAAAGATVSGLTVGLQISGGYNGNLYAYLVAPNGTLVVLMNQPGVGVNGFGASGSVLSGGYNAADSLSGLSGSVADGTWTLFFADMTSGGGTSQLNGWSLNITAESVPEPVTLALVVFLGLVVLRWLLGRCWAGGGHRQCGR